MPSPTLLGQHKKKLTFPSQIGNPVVFATLKFVKRYSFLRHCLNEDDVTARLTESAAAVIHLDVQNSLTMTQKTWVVPLDEDGGISFPADLMKVMEWEEGTVLKWDINDDGSINLKSADQHQGSCLNKTQQQDET